MKHARVPIMVLLVALALAALYAGIRLRRQVFDSTLAEGIHFTNDARNAWGWGHNARIGGLFELYDLAETDYRIRSVYPLDYSPLRLAAVTAWNAWTQRHFPAPVRWRADFDFLAPMLWGNTIAALVSSVFVFLLIRLWTLRMDDAQRPALTDPRPFRGVVMGMLGAALLWFNPAAIWDGYVWGQWEIWIVPFYLGAVYLACLDRWFAAGACVAMGALIKPQLLVVAPVLVVWPMFQLRFGALLRLLAGLGLAFMMVVLPWMKLSVAAFVWYTLAVGAMGLLAPIVLGWKLKWQWALGLSIAALLLAWPWASGASLAHRVLPAAVVGVILLSRLLPAALRPHAFALGVALMIALTFPLFEASSAWFKRGFMYGPSERPQLYQPPMYNIPAMGGYYLRWRSDNHFPVTVPLLGDMSVWAAMLLFHGICVLLAGVGAAIQDRRRDARFLAAVVLPWLTMYIFLTQQQSRYLMWAAAASALLAGVNVGMIFFAVLISLMGALSIDQNVHEAAGVMDRFPRLQNLDPHLGWMLLLIAAILFYNALSPRTRWTRA